MMHQTIDTVEAINRFHELMKPKSDYRVMRLVGNGKMGKSHLLTRVYPYLAQQDYHARWAILDLSYRFHVVPDIFDQACSQMGEEHFISYYAADREWSNRPKVEVKNLHAKLARIGISAKDSIEDARDRDRHLTIQFVKDVSKLNDVPLLLLFDSVDNINEALRIWLIEMLLVKLVRVDHVRIVIAGRFLPEAHSSYKLFCRDYQLVPVTEIEAYFAYCQKVCPTLSEEVVRTLAKAFDYNPGLFVEVLPKFM